MRRVIDGLTITRWGMRVLLILIPFQFYFNVYGTLSVSVAQITAVAADSTADRAGVRPGDLVLEADGARLPTSAAVQAASADGRLLLRLRRGNATFYVALRRDQAAVVRGEPAAPVPRP